MSDLQSCLRAATKRAPNAVEQLRKWVETNSHTDTVENVNAMGELLKSAFSLSELHLLVHPGQGVGDHLFWSTPAWQKRPKQGILLVGHHDTVFPPGTFEGWQRDGDIAKGPGTLDMKGGLTVIQTALAALSDAGLLAQIPVGVLSVGDEEIGSPHSQTITREHAQSAKAALVFEAGRAHDAIITKRKGTAGLKVRFLGKAAHAGNHHQDGINAIWALARFIDQAQALTDYKRGMTVNVGLVSGGSSKNTVPENAECQLDFRFTRAQDGDSLLANLNTLASEIATQTQTQIETQGGLSRPPLEKGEGTQALFEQYASCALAAGLEAPECALLGGGSDANNISALGVPTLDGLGPRGKGFHTHDEFIEVSSLALRTEALVRFLWHEKPATEPSN